MLRASGSVRCADLELVVGDSLDLLLSVLELNVVQQSALLVSVLVGDSSVQSLLLHCAVSAVCCVIRCVDDVGVHFCVERHFAPVQLPPLSIPPRPQPLANESSRAGLNVILHTQHRQQRGSEVSSRSLDDRRTC